MVTETKTTEQFVDYMSEYKGTIDAWETDTTNDERVIVILDFGQAVMYRCFEHGFTLDERKEGVKYLEHEDCTRVEFVRSE